MPAFPRRISPQELEISTNIPDSPEESVDLKTWANIGQPRAIKALEMGIAIRAKGYNLFVAGEPGSGRYTAVKNILNENKHENKKLLDIVYVHNFSDPDKPLALSFPQGSARKFRRDLKALIERFNNQISRALDGANYKNRRDAMIAETEERENKILADFESRLSLAGFRTVQTSDHNQDQATDIVPVINGQSVPFRDLQDWVSTGKISESSWNETRRLYFVFLDEMTRIYRDLMKNREELEKNIKKLKQDTIRKDINREISILKDRWGKGPVSAYIEQLQEDILKNPDWFTLEKDEEETPDLALRYGVNILVDRYGDQGTPIIQETNPTLANLFGVIEARYDMTGELKTNIMMIRVGSLLQANGGFLILQAEDIFAEEDLWHNFKRVLKTRQVEPEIQSSSLGALPILMKPQPIDIDVKVILIGPARLYEKLCCQDEEFQKLFKIVAEFSPVMPRNSRTEGAYASFIKSLIRSEKLRPISIDGIQEVITYGIRLAGRFDRLSTQFGLISDILREANYSAGCARKEEITVHAVKEALQTRAFLGNLPEENQNEQIKEGTLLIDVKGESIGSVNGLAVLERGFYTFGSPLRITTSVGVGKEGVINIEREAGLSGELHDKGIFILEGYLRWRYSRHQPLSLTASLAVEQSYYEIEGDSAAAAELASILSAIGEIPVRQDLAVTGAVDQRGVLLPVGGIPEKIEGFFNSCEAVGLTGTQGVIIPWRSSKTAILTDKVLKALKKKQFHVWLADTIDEVLTLLSGRVAGNLKRNGRFPFNSVNGRIAYGLKKLGEI